MSIANDNPNSISPIVGSASNVRHGSNPVFLYSDFIAMYPQFDATYGQITEDIVQMYIDLANASIQQARWRTSWKLAMGWFVAHFCTLYLQSLASPDSGASAVVAAGEAKGLMTSKSVGDVSAGIDFNLVAQDMDGWAAWKLTVFGQQLATIGRLMGKGGMYVY